MNDSSEAPFDRAVPSHVARAAVPGVARRFLRRLRYVPTERHMFLRRLMFAPVAAFDRLRGRNDPDLPPRWLRIVGRGDFCTTGETFVQHFVQLGGLDPRHAVLDVGCGVGRMALPLTRVLQEDGRYDGFDANAEAVHWCQQHITPRFPCFRFHQVDVRNSRYNPSGRLDAASYTFPYPSNAFDFVCVTSVFTHLAQDGLERYVSESARVLRPGGTLFATFFLIDDDAQRRIDRGASALRFTSKHAGHQQLTLAEHPGDAEYLAAQEEPTVRDLYRRAGLSLRDPILWGSWSGRAPSTDYQDIVIAHRER